jgi:carbon-monoxide dehydrogenase medium subunit
MKPAAFEYHAPTGVEEAVALLGDHGDEAKVLAGGQSLVPLLALRLARVDHLIDVNRIESLAGIHLGTGIEIGATTRHRTAERSPVVQEHAPVVSAALRFVGHAAIRNRGTIGGSLAHSDPAAEMPAVLLALNGSVVARSRRGSRVIPAAELFTGFLSTSLAPDELLTTVQLPAWAPGTGWSVQEFARRSGDFALVGTVCVLALGKSSRVDDARIAMFGVADTVVRAAAAEQLLVGETACSSLWQEAAESAAASLHPPADLHGTSDYRRHVAMTLVRRALEQAAVRARDTIGGAA